MRATGRVIRWVPRNKQNGQEAGRCYWYGDMNDEHMFLFQQQQQKKVVRNSRRNQKTYKNSDLNTKQTKIWHGFEVINRV